MSHAWCGGVGSGHGSSVTGSASGDQSSVTGPNRRRLRTSVSEYGDGGVASGKNSDVRVRPPGKPHAYNSRPAPRKLSRSGAIRKSNAVRGATGTMTSIGIPGPSRVSNAPPWVSANSAISARK